MSSTVVYLHDILTAAHDEPRGSGGGGGGSVPGAVMAMGRRLPGRNGLPARLCSCSSSSSSSDSHRRVRNVNRHLRDDQGCQAQSLLCRNAFLMEILFLAGSFCRRARSSPSGDNMVWDPSNSRNVLFDHGSNCQMVIVGSCRNNGKFKLVLLQVLDTTVG